MFKRGLTVPNVLAIILGMIIVTIYPGILGRKHPVQPTADQVQVRP